MSEDRRLFLLDQLSVIIAELFADGLNEATDTIKRTVLDGLNSERVRICVEITVPPTRISFGIVGRAGGDAIQLFEVESPSVKPITVTNMTGSNDAIN